jgi:hypothetical protein
MSYNPYYQLQPGDKEKYYSRSRASDGSSPIGTRRMVLKKRQKLASINKPITKEFQEGYLDLNGNIWQQHEQTLLPQNGIPLDNMAGL